MTYDDPTSTKSLGRLPAYQRIAESLREDILTGKYPPGSLLPSTEDFASQLSSSYYTVHTALTALVKEGWIERLHGHGTYVAHPDKRFLHAGIYHSLDIFSAEDAGFQRRLNDFLVSKLRALGKTTQIIIDSRPEAEQEGMFEPLAQAIHQRRIQCLISPDPNSKSLPLLLHQPIPTVFMTEFSRNRGVSYDEVGFVHGSIRALAEQGCKTIGFITSVAVIDGNFDQFRQEIRAAGLETRPEWMIQPPEFQHDLIDYGYFAFRQLWKLPKKPDGLIVYPDTAARGAVTAILQARIRVPEELKIAFHRNAYAKILCPFPVTWAISDESATADALIDSIQRQFAGEKPQRTMLPYTFEHDDAARWLK